MQNIFDKGSEIEMSLVADRSNPSSASEGLSNPGAETASGLFDVQDYKSGTVIARSGAMSILAQGDIKVKVRNGVGESTIQVLKPGDILNIGDRAVISTADSGADSQTQTTLYAVGETKVLSVDRVAFENMGKSRPENLHYAIQDVARSVHDILQSMAYQNAELRNYIYRTNGLY